MRLAAIAFAALALPAWATNLDVAPGETYTVTQDQQRMVLQSLSLGDGAVIRFEEGVTHWQLRAERAEIGRDVVVDGRGVSGSDGVDGQSGQQPEQACQAGAAGTTGAEGNDGVDGVSIRMQLGVVALGSLDVLADGGRGGNGGKGGAGSDAGAHSNTCQKAPDGGAAGAGGEGGDGGDGGDVSVQYWAAVQGLNIDAAGRLISVSAEGGDAGTGGKAGARGEGGDGYYINRRTLSGNRKWVGGGSAAVPKADIGEPGETGDKGRLLVEQPLMVQPVAPAPATPVKAAPAASKDAEVDQLKREMRELMERLERLESTQ